MTGLAIVAIPREDSYVWKISSEKKPHMTLLFLGDQSDNPNLDHIINYVEHAAKTTLTRFGLGVDRRGELGDDKADVLFLKPWGIDRIKEFRENLLRDRYILEAFHSTKQFPEWNRHLTLGYPDRPAKEDTRDYPGFHYIDFDRIEVWTGDAEGPSFVLKEDEDIMMSDKTESFLAHYGVLGMKWGVRKPRNKKGTSGRPFKKGETRQLSDDQLRRRINRLTLEKQYKEISKKPKSRGVKFIEEVVENSAKNVATTTLSKAGNTAISLAFAKAAGNVDDTLTQMFFEAMAKRKR